MAAEKSEAVVCVQPYFRPSSEWILAIIYTVASAGSAWLAISGFSNLTEHDLRDGRFGWLVEGVFRLVGPLGFRLAIAIVAIWTGALVAGGLWRLRDRQAIFTADASRLIFHPSIYRAALNWGDIERIEITQGKPTTLAFRLRRRFWSLYVPLSGKSIEIILAGTRMSYRDAEAIMRQMRRWQREARHG